MWLGRKSERIRAFASARRRDQDLWPSLKEKGEQRK
jgi:hypothetical protein